MRLQPGGALRGAVQKATKQGGKGPIWSLALCSSLNNGRQVILHLPPKVIRAPWPQLTVEARMEADSPLSVHAGSSSGLHDPRSKESQRSPTHT